MGGRRRRVGLGSAGRKDSWLRFGWREEEGAKGGKMEGEEGGRGKDGGRKMRGGRGGRCRTWRQGEEEEEGRGRREEEEESKIG